MAFTAPRTWTDGELVTKAIMDPHVRDNFLSMGPHLIARRTANQNTVSTTLASDDTLFTPSIAANEIWLLRLVHYVVTGAGGMKVAWQIPTSGEIQRTTTGDNGTVVVQHTRQTASDTPLTTYVTNAANGRVYIEDALFINAGTAGAVTLRFALNTASGTSTANAQSTLWGVKLA